jgi:hypothetical protein
MTREIFDPWSKTSRLTGCPFGVPGRVEIDVAAYATRRNSSMRDSAVIENGSNPNSRKIITLPHQTLIILRSFGEKRATVPDIRVTIRFPTDLSLIKILGDFPFLNSSPLLPSLEKVMPYHS